jgi:hypothetical protein
MGAITGKGLSDLIRESLAAPTFVMMILLVARTANLMVFWVPGVEFHGALSCFRISERFIGGGGPG